jgi:hypothetical protein
MNINPYIGVGSLNFGDTVEKAHEILGMPLKTGTTRKGQIQLRYPLFILRFDSENRQLNEFTVLPECELTFSGKPVKWDLSFLSELTESDPEMVDLYGFIVSFKNGIALSGFHDGDESGKAIHVFKEGVWSIAPDDEVKPFVLPR